MTTAAKRSDPELWEKVKTRVTKGDKGGEAGQWSARKAQLAVQEYKREGGGYEGRKSQGNSLRQWTEEDWGTQSGRQSAETGERYLPKAAREHLTKDEYARSTARKRQDSKRGKQFSAQPKDVAAKTARYRGTGRSDGPGKAELYEEAKRRKIAGRSKMSKSQLERAIEVAK